MNSKLHLAEKTFGRDRKTIVLRYAGYAQGSFAWTMLRRGNKKTEAKNPQLEADMISLAEPESQTDPEFQTAFKDTLITAKCRAMHLSRTKAEKKKLPQMEERVKNVMFSLSP